MKQATKTFTCFGGECTVSVEGEALRKAALLAGPELAQGWLQHGGVSLLDDSSVQVLTP